MKANISKRMERARFQVGDESVDVALHIWEPPIAKCTTICVHGFAGTGGDFGPLAETLTQRGIKVIAPDLFGRGQSSFLKNDRNYNLRSQLVPLLAAMRLAVGPTCYLGTSIGGFLALLALRGRHWNGAGVVLNDTPTKANKDVQSFRAQLFEECQLTFDTRNEAAEYVLNSRSLTYLKGEWREQFLDGRLREVDGKWRMSFDPLLGKTLGRSNPFTIVRWLQTAPIPVLMLFGEKSPYVHNPLDKKIAAANPNVTLMVLPGDPHPPSLMRPGQISKVAAFLDRCFSRAETAAAQKSEIRSADR